MRKLYLLLAILAVTVSLFTATAVPVFAESADCAALSDETGSDITVSLEPGDVVKVTVTGGTITEFSVTVNGAGPDIYAVGTSATIEITEENSYNIVVEVGDGTIAWSCKGEDDEEGDDDNGRKETICHYPPGNPDAAHTIDVGENAVDAHMAHGDSPGECSDEVNSMQMDYDAGLAIFVLDEVGQVEFWGNCIDDECFPVVIIILADIMEDVAPVEGDSEMYDEDPTDGWYVIVYFLHLDPADEDVGVYQINLYENDTLINDKILLFINADGDVSWASHDVWQDRLDEIFNPKTEEDDD